MKTTIYTIAITLLVTVSSFATTSSNTIITASKITLTQTNNNVDPMAMRWLP